MTSNEMIRIIDSLIGPTEPLGAIELDEERLQNLKNLIDITNWCLDGILRSAEYKYSCADLVSKNGALAFATMFEYKTWFEEKLEELNYRSMKQEGEP